MDNNFSSLCRVCLDSSAVMCSLADRGTRQMLFECTSVWVDPGDIYPQQICAICWNQCMSSSVFRTLARESDRQLRFGKVKEEVKVIEEEEEEVMHEDDGEVEIVQQELRESDEEEEPVHHELVSEEEEAKKVLDDNGIETVQEQEDQKVMYEEEEIEVLTEEQLEYFEEEEVVEGEPEMVEYQENYEENTLTREEEEMPAKVTISKRFKCGYCSKSFHLLPLLQQHLITHERRKPPQREECKSALFQVKPFTQQKLLHAEIKSFDCERCDVKFSLNCHENGHKYPKVNKKCEKCGQEFVHEASLKVHKRTCLSELFKCSKCGLKFRDQEFLSYHTRNHH